MATHPSLPWHLSKAADRVRGLRGSRVSGWVGGRRAVVLRLLKAIPGEVQGNSQASWRPSATQRFNSHSVCQDTHAYSLGMSVFSTRKRIPVHAMGMTV